ncbi:MAG: hypothetical protein GWN99_06550 [Gemmatimonadetes bacterium]|uniref:DUF4199 domain-containing protein n=1 Tax=Candidatus Kutchimonas denitrificans TaxID=3056748 RepID=A0AAE4Z736_9BACT|nr:hypothetical protein [Gemmatimonadota bacterium]NIR73672.1 hypothetical protein [Candidatus Kutchimonas denitrificans]NIS00722.1 hypothetical protein [Gemmatimonadota bacterium]NIT66309.1 hypothetical protein [Gemmatimonadota bacterium]NIU51527.1 hypothetical protein [Gemmatimonadota bacterium]
MDQRRGASVTPDAEPGSGMEERVYPAFIAGAISAVIGGAAWAAIVALTEYEFGWLAWGIGFLVGLAMARMTTARGPALGALAALLAAAGLVIGKALIVIFVTEPALAREIQADETWMAEAAAYELQASRELPPDVQERLDALAYEDTISDALWQDIMAAGAAHADSVGPAGQRRIAAAYADLLLSDADPLALFFGQMTVWDLLWFALGIITAWKIMAREGLRVGAGTEST